MSRRIPSKRLTSKKNNKIAAVTYLICFESDVVVVVVVVVSLWDDPVVDDLDEDALLSCLLSLEM